MLGELVIRIFVPQQLIILESNIWRADNTFGWRRRENLNTKINIGEGTVHLVTDKNGFRINQTTNRNKPPFDISILTLGDSFLAALQVENEQTMPQVLSKTVYDSYGKTVNAVNTGVNDWNPNHYLMQAKRELSKNAYNLGIVFLYVGNDCIHRFVESYPPRKALSRHKFRIPEELSAREIIDSILYPVNDILETQSHLFIFLKTSMKTLLARIGLTAYYFPEIFYIKEKDSKRWEITAEICMKINNEFASKNIPLIFVLLPAPFQVHEEEFYEYISMFDIPEKAVDLEQPNIMLNIEFEKKGLKLLDPLNYMREKAKMGIRMFGLIDDHFNVNGHHYVSEYIFPSVESHLKNILLEIQ